jgi:nitroreductase
VRQVRQFTDDPVSDAQLDAIADVGRWSGSSRNSQPWRFIVLRDTALVRRMGELDMPHSRALTTATGAVVVVIPADGGAPQGHAYDEGRAAERMLIASSMLRLGGGLLWVSPARRESVNELLGIPPGWTARTVVAVGHPADEALAPKVPQGQARLPRSRTVSVDRWSDEQAG